MKTREIEAEEYLERLRSTCPPGAHKVNLAEERSIAHLAGQRIGERRVIELLKSGKVGDGGTADDYADWLEKKLGGSE